MKTATAIAAAVRSGEVTATGVAVRTLDALAADPHVAVTRVLAERALAEAAAVDAKRALGCDLGPLAGVPYAVKDLFDVADLPTTAGSAARAKGPVAAADALAVQRLRAAGAVLCATLNMDAFAYGFATVNADYGTTRNPHDPARLAGGSSGGSAAAVAAGLVSFALGSDTNGSVRIPASLCGLYGVRPARGDLPLAGTFPFAESFDEIGPFAANLGDLALVWDVLRGGAIAPHQGALRVARLGGRFRENADPAQLAAIDAIAPEAPLIELPDVARARSAAFVMTAYEGGKLHRDALAADPFAYDPAVRDRLIAGALLPDALYDEARAFRAEHMARIAALVAEFDVLLAPSAPCAAPLINDPMILIDGELNEARSNLGMHTQPITFTGLPVLAVPLQRAGLLPLGLQLIGKQGGEGALLRLAAELEDRGIVGVTMPANADAGDMT
ncbi:AtzE family amidohydrolase [Novosphingobium sp. PASSN1]|uniref:AtzE family amidohydrolase n=1 Tax=Novosphingobium sp. PASSN1 TaxID=2015561 RepID=UPI000BCB1BE0|nr:AtzE family amidohydrolase [Novosphingobium sp. PASSN1]OYU36949.1 MAG: AtzE family amidohydrolase [Novosphingobium sp. PASSN1]